MKFTETLKTFWYGESARASAPASSGVSTSEAAHWIMETLGNVPIGDGDITIREAFTQADIELALDDRGWLVGGKRMAGELDPLSRQTQVNKSRYYWLRDPLAHQAVRLWTDYALGDEGITYKAESDSVQKQLDRVYKHRKNRAVFSASGQRRSSTRLLVDGELFYAFGKDGRVRNFDCLQITDIITDPDDVETIQGYKRSTWLPAAQNVPVPDTKTLYYRDWTNPDGSVLDPITKKEVKVEQGIVIYHLPFDNLTQRGNGLFSCCSDWLRENRRFMAARVAITQALSKFATKTTVKGGQTMINSVRAKLESTFAQTGLSGGTEHQPPTAPGGNWLQNDGLNLEQFKVQTGGSEAKDDANNLKLMVAPGTGIFLHYFGDPSTGNLATATAMELPMHKMFQSYQKLWVDAHREMQSIILDEDPDDDPEPITNELPAIIEDDLLKLSNFLTAVTQVFPEAKVPELLRQCLSSANVPNLDQVMKSIEDKRNLIDTNAKQGLDASGAPFKNQLPIKTGEMTGDQSLGVSGNSGSLEADRMARLSVAVEKLAESLR